METLIKVVVYEPNGLIHTMKVDDITKARELAQEAVKVNPSCSTNIVISEFEPETPNKTSVSMERYEMVNGLVQRIRY